MKRLITYRLTAMLFIFFVSTAMIGKNTTKLATVLEKQLLYNNVWGTIYNAEVSQCDSTPYITGDGSRINPTKASTHRWIAISQEMLYDLNRQKLLMYPERTNLFKGKIQYGDTVWIESPYKNINGWWVARDAKTVKIKNSVDFLQTSGDDNLYDGDKLWSGKFEDIRIYRLINMQYKNYKKS